MMFDKNRNTIPTNQFIKKWQNLLQKKKRKKLIICTRKIEIRTSLCNGRAERIILRSYSFEIINSFELTTCCFLFIPHVEMFKFLIWFNWNGTLQMLGRDHLFVSVYCKSIQYFHKLFLYNVCYTLLKSTPIFGRNSPFWIVIFL